PPAPRPPPRPTAPRWGGAWRARRAAGGAAPARAPERSQPGGGGARRGLEADLAARQGASHARGGPLAPPAEPRPLAPADPERVEAPRRSVERWIALGPIQRGTVPHLAPEAVERLRAL